MVPDADSSTKTCTNSHTENCRDRRPDAAKAFGAYPPRKLPRGAANIKIGYSLPYQSTSHISNHHAIAAHTHTVITIPQHQLLLYKMLTTQFHNYLYQMLTRPQIPLPSHVAQPININLL